MTYDPTFFEKSVPELELEQLAFWKQNDVFRRSIDSRPADNAWVLYDGPPFATGLPHYGHAHPHTSKDVFPRFQTMKGRRVYRRFGWDTHGVPVEQEVEKALKLGSAGDIDKFGIAEFNEACRAMVLKYTAEWRAMEDRLGRWVDMDNDYKTMDFSFMESVWWVFKELFNKGMIYEGLKVVSFSPGLGTALSDFEAGLNYKDVEDPTIVVAFPLENAPGTSLLALTTTPWTVPSNTAVAINPELEYVRVRQAGAAYVVTREACGRYFDLAEVEVERVPVAELLGQRYKPVFEGHAEATGNTFTVVASSHVTANEGTGLVHIAPAYGPEDYDVGLKYGLPVVDLLDKDGLFRDSMTQVAGMWFKDADAHLLELMRERGRLFKEGRGVHSYPFCWRTQKPLFSRAISSWFVRVEAIRERLLEHNAKVNWYPDFIGKRRFQNWLESAHDWAISRDRFWGTPLPVWRNVDDPSDVLVVGSAAELAEFSGMTLTDLHRHHIDDLVLERDGARYVRVSQVLDCWFESGSMPFAQAHYPFENGRSLDGIFPADFIAEGVDQTRGWFYTLLVLSVALFDQSPYENVLVNGILLGEDGKKMSKSLKNYPPIDDVFTRYGADALRFYLMASGATRAQDAAIKEADINTIVRDVILRILNACKFYAMYANADGYEAVPAVPERLDNPLDGWLLLQVEDFRAEVDRSLSDFDPVSACAAIRTFVDELSTCYIRASRDRFWAGDRTEEKTAAYACLGVALETLAKCIAPIMPFLAEAMFRGLRLGDDSVHLEYWPKAVDRSSFVVDRDSVNLARKVVHLGLRVRHEHGIRTRQPLDAVYLPSSLQTTLQRCDQYIRQELNVKVVIWQTGDQPAAVLEDGLAWASEGSLTLGLNTFVSHDLETEGSVRDLIRQVQRLRKQANYDIDAKIIVGMETQLAGLLDDYLDLFCRETLAIVIDTPMELYDVSGLVKAGGRQGLVTLVERSPAT